MPSCEVWIPFQWSPFDERNYKISRYNSSEAEFSIEVNTSIATGRGTSTRSTRQYLIKENQKRFIKKRHLLADCTTCWSEVSSMLSQLGVPHNVQPDMIHTIYEFVCGIVDERIFMNIKTIPIAVKIKVGQESDLELEEEELARVPDDYEVQFVPTKKSAIEDMLETVEVGSSENRCSVCFKKIRKGHEATRMPCSHVYHETCIVNWLKKSNLCPLCRFEMPAEGDEMLEDEEPFLEDEEFLEGEEPLLEDKEIPVDDEQSLEGEEFPVDDEQCMEDEDFSEDEEQFLEGEDFSEDEE